MQQHIRSPMPCTQTTSSTGSYKDSAFIAAKRRAIPGAFFWAAGRRGKRGTARRLQIFPANVDFSRDEGAGALLKSSAAEPPQEGIRWPSSPPAFPTN